MSAQRAEVDRNFEAFLGLVPKLMAEHEGQWILLRHGEMVGSHFFPDSSSAMRKGTELFGDGVFSVQQITQDVADLGFYSHAVSVVDGK